jgi:hypothetical protein
MLCAPGDVAIPTPDDLTPPRPEAPSRPGLRRAGLRLPATGGDGPGVLSEAVPAPVRATGRNPYEPVPEYDAPLIGRTAYRDPTGERAVARVMRAGDR